MSFYASMTENEDCRCCFVFVQGLPQNEKVTMIHKGSLLPKSCLLLLKMLSLKSQKILKLFRKISKALPKSNVH